MNNRNDVDFATIGRTIIHRTYSERSWNAHFGVPIEHLNEIWNYIADNGVGFKPKHLLYTLYFMKVYNSEDVACSTLKCDPKTYRKWTSFGVALLYDKLPQYPWTHRHNSSCNGVIGSVDVTRVKILKPTRDEIHYYSAKDKFNALKYEVAVSFPPEQRIIWVNGGFKGSVADSTIYRNNLMDYMNADEYMLADLGYLSCPKLITPRRGRELSAQEKSEDFKLNSLRQDIERVNKRIKQFKILNSTFRGHEYRELNWVFHVVCRLTNIIFKSNKL